MSKQLIQISIPLVLGSLLAAAGCGSETRMTRTAKIHSASAFGFHFPSSAASQTSLSRPESTLRGNGTPDNDTRSEAEQQTASSTSESGEPLAPSANEKHQKERSAVHGLRPRVPGPTNTRTPFCFFAWRGAFGVTQ
jgi:hypothetical protein